MSVSCSNVPVSRQSSVRCGLTWRRTRTRTLSAWSPSTKAGKMQIPTTAPLRTRFVPARTTVSQRYVLKWYTISAELMCEHVCCLNESGRRFPGMCPEIPSGSIRHYMQYRTCSAMHVAPCSTMHYTAVCSLRSVPWEGGAMPGLSNGERVYSCFMW